MKNKSKTAPLKLQHQRGFTLVELLLLLTVLAILAGILMPRTNSGPRHSRVTATMADIAGFGSAFFAFKSDSGYYPTGTNGLQALVARPNEAETTWEGPYLDPSKIPLDPWGHPYVYECPGRHNPTSYDIYSLGPDGKGGNKIIGNWTTD